MRLFIDVLFASRGLLRMHRLPPQEWGFTDVFEIIGVGAIHELPFRGN